MKALRRLTVRAALPAPAGPAGRDRGESALVLAPGIARICSSRSIRNCGPSATAIRPGCWAGSAPTGWPRWPRTASSCAGCRTSPMTCATTWSSPAGTSAAGLRRPGRPSDRCPPRSPTSHRSSASPRCCRSTPAVSASWPVTTSRRPRTSARRSSGSVCSTAPATSPSRCRARAGSRSVTRRWTRRGCRSRRCATPRATWSGSRWTCPRAGPCTPRSGWPRSAGCRCCCSTPTSRTTTRPPAGSPTGSTAAARSTGCCRSCCSASAASARCARTARSPATRSPRCSTPTRATPGSWASSGSAS